MFYTPLQANEQIYHETYGGMCCVSFVLYVCVDKTGIIVLFVTCSKPAERSIGEALVLCNTTFHFDYSFTSKCVIHGLLRSEKTSMIPDLTIAECSPDHSSQSCPSCTQESGMFLALSILMHSVLSALWSHIPVLISVSVNDLCSDSELLKCAFSLNFERRMEHICGFCLCQMKTWLVNKACLVHTLV